MKVDARKLADLRQALSEAAARPHLREVLRKPNEVASDLCDDLVEARRDIEMLRSTLMDVLQASKGTYHLEDDYPELIARALSLAEGDQDEKGATK